MSHRLLGEPYLHWFYCYKVWQNFLSADEHAYSSRTYSRSCVRYLSIYIWVSTQQPFLHITILVKQSTSNQRSNNSKAIKSISDLNDLLILNSAAVETPLFFLFRKCSSRLIYLIERSSEGKNRLDNRGLGTSVIQLMWMSHLLIQMSMWKNKIKTGNAGRLNVKIEILSSKPSQIILLLKSAIETIQ